MSTVDLLDDVFIVRQGENRAAALIVINRETGDTIKQADLAGITYSIIRRGQPTGTNAPPPPDEPVEGHTEIDVPVNLSIRDNPPIDPIDGRQYNFLFIIPCVDAAGNDITPFNQVGAIYDMVIRFVPFIGGPRYVMQRTIRIECR